MKRRFFTLFLGTIILWASLAAYSYDTYASHGTHLKPASENVTPAVAPKLSVGEQAESDQLLAAVVSLVIAKPALSFRKILYISPSIHKSVKAYIIFRVFRN